ncbi:MAG: DUF4190 domain-containing protein [Phycisphaerales bacterium]|nr:MAG: DUF4190 domain-containing protein [Phycisphaerales bacterium]
MANIGPASAVPAVDPSAAPPVAVDAVAVRTAPAAAPDPRLPVLRSTDSLAVASAVCGFTAIVPVVSQVAGLALGITSLVRIRRARRCGVDLRGRGWALAGIFSSGFVLLCWVAVIAAFIVVGSLFARSADTLPGLSSLGG